jgi:ketopantoate reductase
VARRLKGHGAERVTEYSFDSVGLRLAASFAEAGAEISLLVREAAIAGLRDRPVHVLGLLGDHVIRAGQVEISDAAAPDDRILGSEMLIVTTKAYDVAEALRPFAGHADQPALLMLQNGLGSAEIARDVMGPDAPVCSTAMMIGMVRNAPKDLAVTAQSSP